MAEQYAAAPSASTLSQLGNQIPKVYYSTFPIAVATSSYTFFQKATTEVYGADTNMDQPGNFPEGTRFDAQFVKFAISSPRVADPAIVNGDTFTTLMNWLETTSLTLKINNIEWCQIPGSALLGSFNFGVKPDVAGDGIALTGNAIPANWYPLKTKNSQTIPFESKVQFSWVLNVWNTTLTSAVINDFRFKLMMAGLYTYQK